MIVDYTPRGEGEAGGWVRIGRYDPVRRRALWARLVEFDGPVRHDWESPGIEAVELCAGREGDDVFVRVGPDNPAFYNLFDCINRAMGAAILSDESEEGDDRDPAPRGLPFYDDDDGRGPVCWCGGCEEDPCSIAAHESKAYTFGLAAAFGLMGMAESLRHAEVVAAGVCHFCEIADPPPNIMAELDSGRLVHAHYTCSVALERERSTTAATLMEGARLLRLRHVGFGSPLGTWTQEQRAEAERLLPDTDAWLAIVEAKNVGK